MKKKMVPIYLQDKDKEDFKAICKEKDISMTRAIEVFVKSQIKRNKK